MRKEILYAVNFVVVICCCMMKCFVFLHIQSLFIISCAFTTTIKKHIFLLCYVFNFFLWFYTFFNSTRKFYVLLLWFCSFNVLFVFQQQSTNIKIDKQNTDLINWKLKNKYTQQERECVGVFFFILHNTIYKA